MMLTEESQKKIEKIRNSQKFCCLKILSDFNYVWEISLVPYRQWETDKHEVKWRSGSYEDLNDAVNSIYSQIDTLL